VLTHSRFQPDKNPSGVKHLWLSSLAVCCLWWWSPALAVPPEARYTPLISATAQQYGLEPALVQAVIKCESGFNPWAQSPRGAQGLMQLMPATQAWLGVTNAFDPHHNVAAGVRYLSLLKHTFGGDVRLMLAAYNAGPQAVVEAGYAVPPFAETQQYVRCVLQAWQQYNQAGSFRLASEVPTTPGPLLAPLAQLLQLKATAVDRYGALALINDQVLSVGQAILGYTVVRIAVGHVELVGQGQKLSLTMVNGPTP
jgi:Transglycosylase SLT domain